MVIGETGITVEIDKSLFLFARQKSNVGCVFFCLWKSARNVY